MIAPSRKNSQCMPKAIQESLLLAVVFLSLGVPTSLADGCAEESGACDAVAPSLLQRGSIASASIEVKESRDSSRDNAAHATQQKAHDAAKFVTSNDLHSLTSATLVHSMILCFHVVLFSIIRHKYPKVFANGWLTGRTSCSPGEGFFSWISASMKLKAEDVVKAAGLDAAMMLKHHDLCIHIMVVLGLPLVVIMCPLYLFYGDAVQIDPLSLVDAQNLTDGNPLYWVQAVVVWIVVVVVEHMVFKAQAEFVALRYEWLKKLPYPRALTCLVQNIPSEYRTDAALKSYVDRIFMRDAVESAYVVRTLPENLCAKLESVRLTRRKLQEARHQWDCDGKDPNKRPRHQATESGNSREVDSIEHYGHQVTADVESIQSDRAEIAKAVKAGDQTVCLPDGFVTFKNRHDAELALSMRTTKNVDEIKLSMPPDPMDVRYEVLVEGSEHQRRNLFVGSLLMMLIFVSYLPIIIGVSLVTSLNTLRHLIPSFNQLIIDHPQVVSFWDGLVGACVLSLIISFVPTIMMIIIRRFEGLAAESWCQHRLQHHYFYYQIMFVLMIFCIGNSLFSTYLALVTNPTRFFNLLANKLPQAAHFYLNFFPLQWSTHAGHICRYVNLVKFCWYKRSVGEQEAHELSEPEDQDYFGMGARSARFSLLLAIALVFCTVCPVICLLALVDFIVSRIAYGYLLVFAETRKADTGGQFWCSQLKHIQHGLFLYISLMVGILSERSGAHGPGLFAALSYMYMIVSYNRMESQFRWTRLPLEDIVDLQPLAKQAESASGHYVQPELMSEGVLKTDLHVGRSD